jgi:DNA repair exonuclease SbcCD nuclease subunit
MPQDFLVVGDPHVVVEELDECRRLADFILEKQREYPRAATVLLGDLYNNHSHIRVEVLAFWESFFARARDTIAIVGNHDRPHRGEGGEHALMAHTNAKVVDVPTVINGIGYIPYMPTPEAFTEAMKTINSPPLVFCHQTFQGARYEAGFFAPDGVPTESLSPGVNIISGHIHTPQQVGPVWYPGAPRWRSIADANVDRFVYLVRWDPDSGTLDVVEKWPTETAGCTPIRILTVDNQEALEAVVSKPGLRIQIQGNEAFVKNAEKQLKDKGVRFRSQITGAVSGKIKESEGVVAAFGHYLAAFDAPNGTPKAELQQLVAARVAW